MAERIRALWQRLLADIHRNPGLWIGVGISAVILVVAYLAYRKQQNSQQSQVPANGYGFPDYSSATGGSSGGLLGGGYGPAQPASPSLPGLPVVSPVSPPPFSSGFNATPPVTAQPAYPPYTFSPAPVAAPVPAYTLVPAVQGRIQNPLRKAQLAHRYDAPTPAVRGHLQNPLAAAQRAHRTAAPTPSVSPVSTRSYLIPTTIRPQTVTTKGRVA